MDKNDGSRHEKKPKLSLQGANGPAVLNLSQSPIAMVTNVNPPSLHYYAASRLKKGRKDRGLSAVKRDRGGLVRQG